MRILILADIHANWAALDAAVREPHDACICLGDLVDYGPEPGPCVRWVRAHAHYCIRGNHDHAVAQNIPGTGDAGYRYLARVTRPLMWARLASDERTYLARLPVTQHLTLDRLRIYLVHATPRDPLEEYLPDDPAQWARRLQGTDRDVVCVGHTHKQFVLPVNGCRVLNPGSVGQPRDGDPRAAYAVIEDGRIELKRAAYEVERTVAAIEASPIPAPAKQFAAHVLRTGGTRANGTGCEQGSPA
jgi:putative phosphoesterase